MHQHTNGASHLQFQLLAAIVRNLYHFRVMLIEHLNPINRDDNVAYLQAGTLRWRLWFNGGHHNRLGTMDAKAKLT